MLPIVSCDRPSVPGLASTRVPISEQRVDSIAKTACESRRRETAPANVIGFPRLKSATVVRRNRNASSRLPSLQDRKSESRAWPLPLASVYVSPVVLTVGGLTA